MTAPVRYRERLPGPDGQPPVEVEVFTPSTWGEPQPTHHYVRYPNVSAYEIPGREYIITDEMLNRHFEILPQKLRVQAWGGVFERPMKAQRELDAKLDAAEKEPADG